MYIHDTSLYGIRKIRASKLDAIYTCTMLHDGGRGAIRKLRRMGEGH